MISSVAEHLVYTEGVGGSNPSSPTIIGKCLPGNAMESVANLACVPVAQLDRASDYGSEGWRFDSSRAHHLGCSEENFRKNVLL